jgi:hypothetical protein
MALIQQWMPDGLRKHINIWRFENFQKGKTSNRSSLAAFDYYQCIFIHIPKTGGISVNDALWGNPGGVHKTIGDYARIFSEETLEAYFKFTFVRNPWDRLVSAYTFLKAGGQHDRDAGWAAAHLSGLDDFESFVRQWLTEENIYRGIHFIPQTAFLKLHGELKVDFIGKLENMAEDFEFVKQKLGIPEARLAHKNRSARQNYHQYYTQETREIVASVYSEDIELLDYSF